MDDFLDLVYAGNPIDQNRVFSVFPEQYQEFGPLLQVPPAVFFLKT